MDTFKLIVVGDAGVGKTTFIKRHRTGEFEKKYLATIGVEAYPLKYNTNYGEMCFNIWDTAGTDKFSGLKDGYYIGGVCALIMFSKDSKNSFRNIPNWILGVKRVCPNIPMVLCGTKYDIQDQKVSDSEISNLTKEYNLTYYDISSKTNYNLEKPFLHLLRELKQDPTLRFVEYNDELD